MNPCHRHPRNPARGPRCSIGGAATLLAVALLLPAWAWGQSPFGAPEEIPAVLATFESRIEPTTARAGEHVRLIVTGRITEGWYTYSVVPQGEFAPPPTQLSLEPTALEVVGPVYETNPIVKKDDVFELTLAFHKKAVRFYQNLRVPEGTAPGPVHLAGALRYQVCNNRLCTPPRTEPLRAALTIEPGDPRPPYAFLQRTIDYLDGGGNFRFDADSLESALAGGLGGFLLLAIGFGLLALVTPCVFPMIPVTVSFFTGMHREGRGTLGLALLFGGGIVLSYTTLGLALTFFLGATGVGRFATSPWVNLAVAGFFAVFALSLMGVFQMALPASWAQGLDQKSRAVKGPVGVLLMGVAFTATSFTCTVPFVGTLLIAATQGQVFWPLVGMVVFSTVFAAPFFLLALFPQFVVGLRGRSGNWLVQVKVVLGLLELMAALKFLSNADLVWQWGLLDRAVLLGAWGALSAVTALVILGLMPWPGVSVTRLRPPRLLLGGVFLAATVYFAAGLTGTELDSLTEAYLPPPVEGRAYAAVVAGGGKGDLLDVQKVHRLPWLASLEAGLAEARLQDKPVFVDFTGYTCVNCRWMEKKVFAERSVFTALRDEFVLVQLYTDGGENAERNQALQIERFRTLALPYYVVLGADNAVLARHAGISPVPAEFLAWLRGGKAQMTLARGSETVTPAR